MWIALVLALLHGSALATEPTPDEVVAWLDRRRPTRPCPQGHDRSGACMERDWQVQRCCGPDVGTDFRPPAEQLLWRAWSYEARAIASERGGAPDAWTELHHAWKLYTTSQSHGPSPLQAEAAFDLAILSWRVGDLATAHAHFLDVVSRSPTPLHARALLGAAATAALLHRADVADLLDRLLDGTPRASLAGEEAEAWDAARALRAQVPP